MKTLYVFRHAKTERESDTGRDFGRALTERGWSDAELVGREMRKRGLEVDAVLSSPATRAAETVEAFARGFGELEPDWEPAIYEASVARLIEIVQDADDGIGRRMIVGHNPGFEGLVSRLAEGDVPGLSDGFPTAGLAAIELPIDEWNNLREGTGEGTTLIVPRDLR